MAVPIPVDITIDPPPAHFKGEYLSDVLNLIAESLHGTMDVHLLTGQIGGSRPTGDVGPWLNGIEWWYWNGKKYVPTVQGCPIGTVAIWGGRGNTPNNWLICQGQALSTTDFPELFQAIGYTWGSSGGNFLLPPPAVFYVNAPNFGDGGVNRRGGAQSAIIPTAAMPALQIQLPYLNPEMIDSNLTVSNTQGGGSSGWYYPVCDEHGVILGTNQKRIPIMPPFVAANFIIKFL